MLALHRFLQDPSNEVISLVNMCDEASNRSRSHGLGADVVRRQAEAMGLRITQEKTDSTHYEERFKGVIARLKAEGVTAGVFGDLYLNEHRVWIERVCRESGVEAVFPLWENDTKGLLRELIDEGFEALTVSVRVSMLPESWLGRSLDKAFYEDIIGLEGIDPCAENGEYHSFVFNGPIFKEAVRFTTGERYSADKHIFLPVQLV